MCIYEIGNGENKEKDVKSPKNNTTRTISLSGISFGNILGIDELLANHIMTVTDFGVEAEKAHDHPSGPGEGVEDNHKVRIGIELEFQGAERSRI